MQVEINRVTWRNVQANVENSLPYDPFLPYFLYLKMNYAKFYSTDHLFRHFKLFKRVKGSHMNLLSHNSRFL